MLQNIITRDKRERNKDRGINDSKWYEDPTSVRQVPANGWNSAASIGKDTAPTPFPLYDPQPPVHF